MRLDAAPHVGDGALRRHAEHLRQRERRDRLDQRRGAGGEAPAAQQIGAVLPDDVVDEVLGGAGQDEAGEAVDEHQHQPERQPAAARPDQRPRFLPRVRVVDLFLLRGLVGGVGAKRLSGPPALSRAASRMPPPRIGIIIGRTLTFVRLSRRSSTRRLRHPSSGMRNPEPVATPDIWHCRIPLPHADPLPSEIDPQFPDDLTA